MLRKCRALWRLLPGPGPTLTALTALIALTACSAGSSPSGGVTTDVVTDAGSDADTGTGPSVGETGGGFDALVPATDATALGACAETTKLVYVVTKSNELHRFSPTDLTFTKIGTLGCPAKPTATPHSMAVDRNGTAWVLYTDGRIYLVSTADASCTVSPYLRNQSGYFAFGMAFVSDGVDAKNERLMISDRDTTRIGVIDTKTLVVSTLGDHGVPIFPPTELSGTGSGRAFLYAAVDGVIAEIDRKTGVQSSYHKVPSASLSEAGSGFAFAHWGGDLWLFSGTAGTSRVIRYEYDADVAKTMVGDGALTIVGAGVSTCAPATRPK